jgi:FkbM family methyltransferase
MYYGDLEIDKFILESFFKDYKGIMIEIGAGPTTSFSMSKAFRERGWRAICVDANPYYVNLHKSEGNEVYHYALSNEILKNQDFEIINPDTPCQLAGSSIKLRNANLINSPKKIIKVDIITLDWLLELLSVDKLDYISIDVEGWELEVMKGFNAQKYNPKVIVLENFLNEDSYIKYMNSIGYSFLKKIYFNDIYVK